MRIPPVLTTVVAFFAATAIGCGDVTPTPTEPPTSSSTSAAPDETSTTAAPAVEIESTTTPPPGPTVTWQETLALGSAVAVRHLAVSNGKFLALAEADRVIPGEVAVSAFLSADGEHWDEVELPPEQFAGAVFLEFGGGPAGFIATGTIIGENENDSGHLVWTSPDGADWTRSELEINLTEATSPYVVTAVDPYSVVANEDSFLIAWQTRRYLDTEAIIADHQPDFEWPEFPYMATETLDTEDVMLTIGGDQGNDFVTTFSSLGIDPEEFPVAAMETDWFTVPVGSMLWTSTNGIDWIQQAAPNMAQHLGTALPIDSTAFGLYAHGWEAASGAGHSWHSTAGSDWVEVDIPGQPVVDWSGGLYAFDSGGRMWISANGISWVETAGPTALTDTRELRPATGALDSAIAVGGIRPDAAWADGTIPESWVAVSTDGATWWEATGLEAFGMPIWPEAIASAGDRVVIGLAGGPPSAMPQTYLWLGKVTEP